MEHHISIRLLFQYYCRWELRDEDSYNLCDTNWDDEFLDSVAFWVWASNKVYLYDKEAVLFVGDCVKSIINSLVEKLGNPVHIIQHDNVIDIKTNEQEQPVYWIRRA